MADAPDSDRADCLAALRPTVREVIDAGIAENWCMTAEVEGRPELWVQVSAKDFNAAYPAGPFEPQTALPTLGLAVPDWATLVTWTPDGYATFHHAGADASGLAGFATDWFMKVLLKTPDERSGAAIDVKIERLN